MARRTPAEVSAKVAALQSERADSRHRPGQPVV